MDPNAAPPDPGITVLVDKPLRWTSFDVIKKLRSAWRIKKVGHAGTLDPLATGLLIICTGKKTKQIEQYQAMEKEYTGQLMIGKTTPSFDLETEVDTTSSIDTITDELILKKATHFEGWIEQVPPAFSAIKVKGKRAYESAREGEKVELKPRKVEVKRFEITAIDLPYVSFNIICSKGTYIRSIARDFGALLGVGAHLTALRRTRIGKFNVEQAQSIEDLISNEYLSWNRRL